MVSLGQGLISSGDATPMALSIVPSTVLEILQRLLRASRVSQAAILHVNHKVVSFCSLGFSSLYLWGQMKVFSARGSGSWRLVAGLCPLVLALVIALSRTCDYHHHWQACTMLMRANSPKRVRG
ncbi:PPAPDC1B [Cordylochernes scorpioides]|uniref:PPAPDC1B n=1 Tax=Cordylochernes scorpioides TaxID=51811 RepID=A0ABY6JW33_9ARAC|nr:PPAPDC1B [Cordylochernes scorpioides]